MLLEKFTFDASGQSRVLAVSGFDEFAFQLAGTASMTIVAEGTIDGTNWISTPILSLAGASGSPATAGIYHFSGAGFATVRLRVSAYSSGSYSVALGKTTASLVVR